MSEWEVKLAVSGPISVKSTISVIAEKGEIDPFQTNITIRKAIHGVWVSIIARADSQESANDAALYFVGQTLDVLCLKTNLPTHLSITGTQFKAIEDNVRRLVTGHEWQETFRLGREYGLNHAIYSRALGWYRKGVNTEDPIDKFIAFWSCLEGFGAQSAQRTERTSRGAINQIANCFDQLWGEASRWKVIPNQAEWLNKFHETRNGIAHGYTSVNIDTLKDISLQLPKIRLLAHTFLVEWKTQNIQLAG